MNSRHKGKFQNVGNRTSPKYQFAATDSNGDDAGNFINTDFELLYHLDLDEETFEAGCSVDLVSRSIRRMYMGSERKIVWKEDCSWGKCIFLRCKCVLKIEKKRMEKRIFLKVVYLYAKHFR